MAKLFLGVAWPYASGPRHIGHAAGAYVPADIFARYHRMAGDEVLMVSGSDMHGTPTTVRAEEEGVSPEEVAERFHAIHTESFEALGISWDLYWKTSDPAHAALVRDVFLRLKDRGHVYEDSMDAAWCPHDERFRPDRYIEGECPHCHFKAARGDQCENCGRILDPFDLIGPRCQVCGTAVERRETRHYFLRLSAFQTALKTWLQTKSHWRPHVLNFALSWLREGLKDRPITRDIDWGIDVPLPGYEKKRIYVWFEAVQGYLSASQEWARRQGDPEKWKAWWEDPDARHYYFIGKDNIVFHTLIWPAILMGYDETLDLPYDVPANQFMTFQGERMSAGRGVGVWLQDLLGAYDPDALRYYVSANMPENRDSEFTFEELARRVNNELVAIYGNFVHRVLTFTHKNFGKVPPAGDLTAEDEAFLHELEEAWRQVGQNLAYVHFRDALQSIMRLAKRGNQYFDAQAPWDLLTQDRGRVGTVLHVATRVVRGLALLTAPFLPFSAQRLWGYLGYDGPVEGTPWEAVPEEIAEGQRLQAPKPLFRKIELAALPVEEAERLDVRVGEVTKVEDHPDADKLYVVEADLGSERRTMVAGMREEYEPGELEGKRVAILVNLKPGTFRGVRSDAMLLAAVDGSVISLLLTEDAEPGTQILGTPGAPRLSFEEFKKLRIEVGEDGRVYFHGSSRGPGLPLKAGKREVTLDRPVRPGSEVT
ncbi:MAG: methionine--tRNA ligase [Candidatus Thermoplasmatota archaeon]|nr:methionine--tRNA ligase [Candidatus Thermoplasmatota archaeon]